MIFLIIITFSKLMQILKHFRSEAESASVIRWNQTMQSAVSTGRNKCQSSDNSGYSEGFCFIDCLFKKSNTDVWWSQPICNFYLLLQFIIYLLPHSIFDVWRLHTLTTTTTLTQRLRLLHSNGLNWLHFTW